MLDIHQVNKNPQLQVSAVSERGSAPLPVQIPLGSQVQVIVRHGLQNRPPEAPQGPGEAGPSHDLHQGLQGEAV